MTKLITESVAIVKSETNNRAYPLQELDFILEVTLTTSGNFDGVTWEQVAEAAMSQWKELEIK